MRTQIDPTSNVFNNDFHGDVYSLEDFYILEDSIHIQLYNITRYLSFFPDEYKYNLSMYSQEKNYIQEDVVLSWLLDMTQESELWVEKEIPKTNESILFLKRHSFICFNSNGIMYSGRYHPDTALFLAEANIISTLLSIRSALHKNSINFKPTYSAHINVGQGCCSFLFNDLDIIGIDCSNRELPYLNNSEYHQNDIDYFLSYFKQKQNVSSFSLKAFVLTHAHYDHYSGIFNLINNGYINQNTDFYVNVQHKSSSPLYNNLIKLLLQKNVNIVHSTPQHSSGNLIFLYPLISTKNSKNINNNSVIFCVKCPSGNFIFPGDMENQGWNKQASATSRTIQSAKYFAISHHGSKTGYSPSYFPTSPKASIMMVRNNAYPNVPDTKIFNQTFNHNKNVISTNDLKQQNKSFYLIDLSSGKFKAKP